MKRPQKYKSFLSVTIAAVICMVGGITAFAYCPPDTITNENDEPVSVNLAVLDELFLPEKLISDCFAVADDGTIYDFCHINENDRKNCDHNYSVPIEMTDHQKNGNGGCTVKIYSALKCSKCADKKIGELLSTITFNPCPH